MSSITSQERLVARSVLFGIADRIMVDEEAIDNLPQDEQDTIIHTIAELVDRLRWAQEEYYGWAKAER